MASFSIIALGAKAKMNRDAFQREHPHPWLVWWPEAKGGANKALSFRTMSGAAVALGEEGGEPIAIEVVKRPDLNDFSFGVTIGRADNNDVVVAHEQVSRFHAYIQTKPEGRFLVDAGSKNGTFLGGRRLAASKPERLPPETAVHLGQLEVMFFEPERLVVFLEKQIAGGEIPVSTKRN